MNKLKSIQDVLFVLMKITLTQFLVMVFLTTLVSAADTNGQGILDRKISIQASNKEIKLILEDIEKQALVHFTYRAKLVKPLRKTSLNVTNVPISKVLDQLFSPDIEFVAVDEEIILTPTAGVATPEETYAISQTSFSVTGQVKDNTGVALPGVNVLEKGTVNGTATDSNGQFNLTLSNGEATLVFSFIGFVAQEISIRNQSEINVVMTEDIQTLSEVVVVGYGTIKKKDLTGAVSQVSNDEFNGGVNTNPLQSIQGKVAGLVITQPSGDPNQAPTVRLRGYTSLAGGSDPLYVVDGVIGVPINSVSPNDIETMDVLKDASAAAIYGSRAANGVIIITTKRGKAGKTSLSFNNYIAVEDISSKIDLLNADEYRAEVTRVVGASALSDPKRFPVGPGGAPYVTDWMDEITRTGYTNSHELALSGGTDKVNYRGSLNYINREGVMKNSGFERINGRINIDQKAFNDKLSVQYNLSQTNANGKLFDNAILNSAVLYLPTVPVKNIDGSADNAGYYEIGTQELKNPVAMLEGTQNDRTSRVSIGGVNIRYEVLKGLTLGINGALRNEAVVTSQVQNGEVLAWKGGQGLASRALDQINNSLLELTAGYTREFDESQSNFSVLGGYSYQDNVSDGFRALNNNFLSGFYDLLGYDKLGAGSGTLIQPSSNYTSSYKNRTTLVSFFGRATVNLKDKYNLTATLRRDGSSKFGSNNRWGLFPSFAAGWTISNESFMQGATVLSYLKLRAGWGQIGNSEGISPYQSQLLYGQVSNNYYDGGIKDFLPGYNVIQNANPDLKWEVVETTNVGIDFQLFNGRVNGALDAYDKRTKDMLYNYNVPADGSKYYVPEILANVGEMSNKGIELSIGGDVINGNNFKWTVTIVGQVQESKVVSLKNDEYSVGIIRYNALTGAGLSSTYASLLQEGHSYGEFTVPQFSGFNEAGKMTFVAAGGDSTTTLASIAKLVTPGTALPQTTASLINTFRFKRWDLSFMLRGTFGNKIYNNLRSNLTIPGSILTTNMLREVSNYPTTYTTNQLSGLWLESGTYIRLDNWQIGYNFPVNVRVLQSARIFAGGNNLFLLTKYKGIDPELQVKGDLQRDAQNRVTQVPNSVGMDNGIYPRTRSFQLGVNLTF